MEKFGYLTGRSLATFKRVFKKAFNATPQIDRSSTHQLLGAIIDFQNGGPKIIADHTTASPSFIF